MFIAAGEHTVFMAMTTDWSAAIADYLTAQRAAGAPSTTCTTRRQHLEHLARWSQLGPWQLTDAVLLDYMGSHVWALETRRGRRTTLRSFMAWAVAAGRRPDNPALSLPRVKAGQPMARPTPEHVYRQALLDASPRAALILQLAGQLGLRRAEIAAIHSSHVQRDLIGYSLLVTGKGQRQRLVPLPDQLARRILDADGYLFPGDDNGHLSPRWVGKIATRALPDGWTLHTLRHRFATMAYDVDRDVFTVQQLLGHSSPATTRRYVATRDDNLRRTVLAIAGVA